MDEATIKTRDLYALRVKNDEFHLFVAGVQQTVAIMTNC